MEDHHAMVGNGPFEPLAALIIIFIITIIIIIIIIRVFESLLLRGLKISQF